MHDLDRTLQESSETFEFTAEGEWNEVLQEAELQELAAELLEISSDQELDRFLGGLIKKVGGAIGKVAVSPLGKQVGGMLKGLAKKYLPVAGAALGNLIAPGVGGAIGGRLASMAGSAFGLETEGLSLEDRDYEVAKQFVRLAADATRTALSSPNAVDPAAVAQAAVSRAVQRYAPGLAMAAPFNSATATATPIGASSGRWVRRGRRIVLYGV
ncbi:MAG: hypothetical protein HY901_13465 [Deltaproteobacteria bacterium]|nr:hypothetical protein [Deltaproteobacteria bacterium]